MKTQELFASVWGMLLVILKITDEFTEQDAEAIVYDFAIRQGGELVDETLGDGQYLMKFETEEEAEQAKKSFRRLSRMRPGFAVLTYLVWSEK